MLGSLYNRQHRTIIPYFLIITIGFVWPIFTDQNCSAEIKAQSTPPQEKVSYNRLINESSPYLMQHATNPVDWYPWGKEAFDRARQKDKPIFLSVGYSTCHWCHVMEHESFADPDVAEILNRNTPRRLKELPISSCDSETILVRQKDVYDGAIPSGNSFALLNLLRLAPFTRNMKVMNNLPTAYVCQDFLCKLPTNSVTRMQANLKSTGG